MQPFRVPVLPAPVRIRPRTALVASADRSFRQRLNEVLTGLRWHVREAGGGAEAWTEAEAAIPEAVIVDCWLPDLDHDEFLASFRRTFPDVDLLVANGTDSGDGPRCPHRQELLYALRRTQDGDTASWNPSSAADFSASRNHAGATHIEAPATFTVQAPRKPVLRIDSRRAEPEEAPMQENTELETTEPPAMQVVAPAAPRISPAERLPELIGEAACMLEVSRRIRLVAPRSTPVLIEGPTGSGKELVAEAVHRLSPRSRKPFVAINCAAIPEALLEAELFGHTRGAFTGAVQGRVGRIEAADGGTLFLDEIGEMPLALQAKLLRFVECGELQRVGDNETVKVDVRVVAATHRPLADHASTGAFRSDLYYRLAVFLVRTPPLSAHLEDLPLLVEHFLDRLGRKMPKKRIGADALEKLVGHTWPGNVRELEHVLERGAILASDAPVMTAEEIDFGLTVH
ncbi:MAG: sigma-54 dependent transcriptional regulator [Acidobacteriaceae bacterium]|nr:sigma-54 dependent transcriptional regulator [Acidobacteriaceae bacterium]